MKRIILFGVLILVLLNGCAEIKSKLKIEKDTFEECVEKAKEVTPQIIPLCRYYTSYDTFAICINDKFFPLRRGTNLGENINYLYYDLEYAKKIKQGTAEELVYNNIETEAVINEEGVITGRIVTRLRFKMLPIIQPPFDLESKIDDCNSPGDCESGQYEGDGLIIDLRISECEITTTEEKADV